MLALLGERDHNKQIILMILRLSKSNKHISHSMKIILAAIIARAANMIYSIVSPPIALASTL